MTFPVNHTTTLQFLRSPSHWLGRGWMRLKESIHNLVAEAWLLCRCAIVLLEKPLDGGPLMRRRTGYFLSEVWRKQFQGMTSFSLEFSEGFGSPPSLIFLWEAFIYHPDIISGCTAWCWWYFCQREECSAIVRAILHETETLICTICFTKKAQCGNAFAIPEAISLRHEMNICCVRAFGLTLKKRKDRTSRQILSQ